MASGENLKFPYTTKRPSETEAFKHKHLGWMSSRVFEQWLPGR